MVVRLCRSSRVYIILVGSSFIAGNWLYLVYHYVNYCLFQLTCCNLSPKTYLPLFLLKTMYYASEHVSHHPEGRLH